MNNSYPQSGINPAMLASFAQQRGGGSVNPSQLMGGAGGIKPPSMPNMQMGSINPAQLLSQQSGQNFMNGMNGMGGGGSINPSALTGGGGGGSPSIPSHIPSGIPSSPSLSSASHPGMGGMGMNMGGGGGGGMAGMNASMNLNANASMGLGHQNPGQQNPSSHMHPQQQNQQQQILQMLGMTPQQFSALSPQEKQAKMMQLQQQQMLMRQQALMRDQNQGGASNMSGGGGGMGGMANMAGGAGGGMGGMGMQQQHPGMQQPGFAGQQSSMQHGSQGFNPQSMNNMGMNNMGAMGGMNSMFNQNQPSSQQSMNQQNPGDMLGRSGSAMGMHPNSSGGEFFNRPGSSMGMNPMMANSMMNNLNSGMGGMSQNMPGMSNNLGNMGMNMNLGGGGMGGSSMPGMGGMPGHQQHQQQQQQHPSQGHQQHPSQGQLGQGAMGPPSGIPRGPGGMGTPSGMSISTGMRNISGTHTPGPTGSARPPSRAMSATPANASISGRGMSPSTPVSAQPGQQSAPGQNPYPPSTPAPQQNQGQQGQRSTPTPGPGPRPQSSQSQRHSPIVPPQSPSTRGPSVGPPNVNLSQGIKRKAEDAPLGSPTIPTAPSISAGPMMGPPSLPRTLSTSSGMGAGDMMNGMVPQRPGSSVGMNGMHGMQQHQQQSASAPPGGQPGMPQQPPVPQGMPTGGPQAQRQGSVPLRQGSVPLSTGPASLPHTPMMVSSGMPGAVKAGSVPPEMGFPSPISAPPGPGPVPAPQTATAAAASTPTAPPSVPPAAPAQQPVNYSLPPLPANVSLNPAVTRVSVVPLATSLTSIPALDEKEIDDIKEWMEKDKEYEGIWRGMKDKMNKEIRGVIAGGTYEQQLQFERAAAVEAKKEPGKEGEDEKTKGTQKIYNGAGVGGGWVGWWEKGGNLFDGYGMKGVMEGPQGYGNMNRWRRPREPFDVRYPRHRKDGHSHTGGRGRRGRREGLRLPRKLDPEEVNKPELLVPIRLEFDVEHHRMRDTFIWNLNDSVVTPEHFAQTIVEDYNLAPSYHSIIVKSIQDQLSDYRAHSGMFEPDGTEQQIATSPVVAPATLKQEGEDKENEGINGLVNGAAKGETRTDLRGVLDDENGRWWKDWRSNVNKLARPNKRRAKKKRRTIVKDEEGMDADVEDAEEEGATELKKGMKLNEFELKEELFHEDMRILIRLDIIVGSMKLDDQFEWDLDNENASPEEFAEVYCQDLGLNGEFKTAIAHLIREQVQTYQKSLFLVGHPSDGSPIQDDDLRSSFLPSLTTAARPSDQVQAYTPLLNYLSDGEIERNEKERDKDMTKRRKRNTRGRRGIALPDREPIRTYRTPAIGFPELDPATLALAAAANAPVSRRAAAAAASLTIASMVASENGEKFTPTLPTATITPTAPAAVKKEKTVKGLFKAPQLPSPILKARTQALSTAADVSTLPAPLENDPPPLVPSVSITSAPEGSRFSKLMTARRAKELEREAKEKEFVDGQHPNMINGVWHCSNCGCPESIAIGRRKGPLGDKSQCGTCGKYWHRHRRPRPVEYNPDPEYHSGLKRDSENATKSAAAKKKGGAAALRAQNSVSTPAGSAPPTPSRTNGDVEMSSRQSPALGPLDDDDRPISPVSSASDASETPLVQRIKANGHARATTPPASVSTPSSKAAPGTPTPAPRSKTEPSEDDKKPVDNVLSSPVNSSKSIPNQPPIWLIKAKEGMMSKYPNDRFDCILRKANSGASPEWRIKCLDCPGKLYTPGPGETLSNYEVHLKNRQHRQRVNDRIAQTNGDA